MHAQALPGDLTRAHLVTLSRPQSSPNPMSRKCTAVSDVFSKSELWKRDPKQGAQGKKKPWTAQAQHRHILPVAMANAFEGPRTQRLRSLALGFCLADMPASGTTIRTVILILLVIIVGINMIVKRTVELIIVIITIIKIQIVIWVPQVYSQGIEFGHGQS